MELDLSKTVKYYLIYEIRIGEKSYLSESFIRANMWIMRDLHRRLNGQESRIINQLPSCQNHEKKNSAAPPALPTNTPYRASVPEHFHSKKCSYYSLSRSTFSLYNSRAATRPLVAKSFPSSQASWEDFRWLVE